MTQNPLTSPDMLQSTAYYATTLALVEIGLGSVLHALRIPFSGHLLSLNQCFLLNLALLSSLGAPRSQPMLISNTAALLKSLTPIGKKFRPMIAICMQGVLFNIGTFCFGKSLLGRLVGSILLSLWAFVQSFTVYALIFNGHLLDLARFYNDTLTRIPALSFLRIELLLGLLLGVKVGLAIGICCLTGFFPKRWIERYQERMLCAAQQHRKRRKAKSLFGQILKDLTSPLFLLSLAATAFFFYATLHSWEATLWPLLRLLAIACITFYLLRRLSNQTLLAWMQRWGLKRYAPYVERALEALRSSSFSSSKE